MDKKRFPIFSLLVCIVVISAASFGVYFVSSAASSYNQAAARYDRLEARLSYFLRSFRGEYSIIIKDLKRPSLSIAYNEDEAFPAASLIKLPVLAASMQAVKDGRVSLRQVITIKRSDVAGGSGVIKTLRLPIRLSFKKLLELMVARSDNTATNKIIDILGYDYLNGSFAKLGLSKTVLVRKMMDFSRRRFGEDNYTTTSEISFLLEKIYQGKLVDEQSSRFMLSLLKKQQLRDRIPRYLPKGVTVAHKTGLESGVVHDAGIVFSSRGDYVICVLTKKVKNCFKAKRFIGRVSFLAYRMYQRPL